MIEELQRFILVAKEGNLTKTAEKIFITQSALSQSIMRLEKALGTQLFANHGKQLRLTDDGMAVVTIGEKILSLWENAKNAEMRKTTQNIYTVGVFDNAALRLGPYFQKNLDEDSFQLEVVIDASSKLLKQLQLGVIDVAICVVDQKSTLPKDIILVKTFTESLIPVSAKTFRGNIDSIPFILYNKGSRTREHIDFVFTKHGLSPNVVAESTSVTFMKELAILGSGVALLPPNFIQTELTYGTLKKQRLPMHWQRKYGLYLHKNSSLQPKDDMIQTMVKILNKK